MYMLTTKWNLPFFNCLDSHPHWRRARGAHQVSDRNERPRFGWHPRHLQATGLISSSSSCHISAKKKWQKKKRSQKCFRISKYCRHSKFKRLHRVAIQTSVGQKLPEPFFNTAESFERFIQETWKTAFSNWKPNMWKRPKNSHHIYLTLAPIAPFDPIKHGCCLQLPKVCQFILPQLVWATAFVLTSYYQE